MDELEPLQKQLGYFFKDEKLLIEALTHKSYKQPYNNERLEFLGDAVLDLIIGEYLFKRYATSDEGILSKVRASIVNEEGFTKLAMHLDLGSFIFMSNAEINNKGRQKPSLLSDAFEAVMGAIYLEGGLQVTTTIVLKIFNEVYADTDLTTLSKDFKTTLQEITQARFGVTPEYKLVSSSGPDHLKTFDIALFIDGKEYAMASGKSKKGAQQEAALKTIELLEKEHS
ncbi:MAG: ribonuclease III [Thiovulaceae bacterium]|nr:ribonuclease III [Sulfurimonadaceae bacterium]